jgi:AAA+ ATPase superfamily predicted ATPase
MTVFNQFKGRKRELILLTQLWQQKDATMLVLYGRRRIGKTRLLTHWVNQNKVRALYWVAEPSSAFDQLRSFSQALYNFANPSAPAPFDFTYTNWEQAWQQVASLAQQERLAILIDEFTYLLEIDPSLAGTLQNLWDHALRQSNLFLVICGSHMGMMQREFLSYQAPLYGRATSLIHLRPIPFGNTADFFPRYKADERVAIYAIFGGIPAYWERLDPERSISENIRLQLLTANNLMQAEPRLLLQDFVNEPHNYAGILRAIGGGARTQKEISNRAGLQQGHVSKYLSILQETGFVERRVPVTASERSRLGRYHITDPYLRFYFRFLAPRQSQLEIGIQEPALTEIKRHLLDFIATYTWEELCREWTLRASALQELPFLIDDIGSVWTQSAQVDVVGINSMDKTILLGECKWQTKLTDQKPLEQLIAKTMEIVPEQGHWQVYYLGFARNGWTKAAEEYTTTIQASSIRGRNWLTVGMKLINLEQLDGNLHAWL